MSRPLATVVVAVALALGACAPPPGDPHPSIRQDDGKTRWLAAKYRYSDQLDGNIDYAKRCRVSPPMRQRGCQATVNELIEATELAEEALEHGDSAVSFGSDEDVETAIGEVDAMIGMMRDIIETGDRP